MATHARIGIIQDGTVRSVYSHWDGYPSYMLPRLAAYSTVEQVNALLDLGDLSSLESTLETCVAYSRDRGEDTCADVGTLANTRKLCRAQYAPFLYIFDPQTGWSECYED